MDTAILDEQHHLSTTAPARTHDPAGGPQLVDLVAKVGCCTLFPALGTVPTVHNVTVMQAAAWGTSPSGV